ISHYKIYPFLLKNNNTLILISITILFQNILLKIRGAYIMSSFVVERFRNDLINIITNGENNKKLKVADTTENKLAIHFGMEDVYNTFRIRTGKGGGYSPGITVQISITCPGKNCDLFEDLEKKENINAIENEINENIEANKVSNKRHKPNEKYKPVGFEYDIDLTKCSDCERTLALCEISYKAIRLMKIVYKLHKNRSN
ncbi:MAG: hypothetical protein FWH29_11070, partial [Methanobrevibacter sp.]|nr:hypothetical protein [Methanobrevibacter sp.]